MLQIRSILPTILINVFFFKNNPCTVRACRVRRNQRRAVRRVHERRRVLQVPEIFVKAVCVGYSSNGQRRGGEGGNKTGNDRGGVVVNRKKEREREANVVKNTTVRNLDCYRFCSLVLALLLAVAASIFCKSSVRRLQW